MHRCYDAPQLWQLGWVPLLRTLNAQNLPDGEWTQSLSLPALASVAPSTLQASCPKPACYYLPALASVAPQLPGTWQPGCCLAVAGSL